MSVLGTVAAAATFVVTGGNVQAAMLAYSVGSGVESVINPPKIEGPRLDDLEVQTASYGAAIPFDYGTNRQAGTIIWPKLIELVEHEQTESAKGGPEQTTYSYSASFAVLICEGPIAGVRRIWANKKLIYDVSTGVGSELVPDNNPAPTDPAPTEPTENDGNLIDFARNIAQRDPAIGSLRFYLGTETQSPDPLIEATDGPSPAYLGYAYCVFEDLDLTDFANRPPQLEFEVLTVGESDRPDAVAIGAGGGDSAIDPNTGYIWSVQRSYNAETVTVAIADNATQTTINTITVNPNYGLGIMGTSICYVDSLNQVMVANSSGTNLLIFDAASQSLVQQVDLYDSVHQCLDAQPAPGLSWVGIIRYDKANDLVLIGSSNLSTVIRAYNPRFNVSASDPCDSTKQYFPYRYPVYVALPPPNSIFAVNNMTTSGAGLTLAITNGHIVVLERKVVVHDLEVPDISASRNGISYDTKRNLLLVVPELTSKLIIVSALSGAIEIHDMALPEGADGNAGAAFRDVLYHKQTDRYYITAHTAASYWTVWSVVPESLDVEWVRTFSGPANTGTMIEAPDAPGYFLYADSSSATVYRIPLGTVLEPHPVNLGAIVADICARAGLSAGEIDVSQLTDEVDGYIVPRQMSARAAIEPLQTAFFFDAVESDNKLKFVKRGAGTPITIPMEDRAARDFGSDLPDSLSIVRAQDMELPVQVDVEYADIDADHLVGNQYARRITKDTKTRVNIQSPVVMNATKGKQVADVTLYRAWLNQSYKFTTTRKWAHLEPTDIVILPTLEASYTARIVSKREQPNGVIEWEAAMEGVEVYTQSGAGAAPTNYVKQTIYAPGSTTLQLLDVPMLRDEDNNAGFYDVMAGSSASWTGAQLFKSADGGSTYEPVHITSDPATMGATQSALPDFTAGNIVDEGSSVTVMMRSGSALTSITDTQLFNGANLALIGAPGRWEVVQFRTATLIAPKTYQLSGFLRGRRGTEWATGTHQSGDTFILAGLAGWSRLVANADVGLERKYKAPAFRMPLSSAPAQTFTNTGTALKPFAPVDLTGERDSSGNLTMRWNRRTRLIGDTLHMARPLGEAAESYAVDIVSGETVLRTLTSSTPSVVYSAADQAADGITPGAAVTASVFQLSGSVGRGYPLKGTV